MVWGGKSTKRDDGSDNESESGDDRDEYDIEPDFCITEDSITIRSIANTDMYTEGNYSYNVWIKEQNRSIKRAKKSGNQYVMDGLASDTHYDVYVIQNSDGYEESITRFPVKTN